jgi:hypothetical protein
MNFDRIAVKYAPKYPTYFVLSKLSDFSKTYLCMDAIPMSMQKTNAGSDIMAFDIKNIEGFKGTRPFFVLPESRIVENIKKFGIIEDYETKLQWMDLVRYNGMKFLVLGNIVNTYAQWNMPTPLLFNPNDMVHDYRSLYGSKLSDIEINRMINDNFQNGKYDDDMIVPLVDSNDYKEDIEVLEKRPTTPEVEFLVDRYLDEKNTKLKAQNNIFIDTILRNRGLEIDKLRDNNKELYDSMQTMLLSVNKAINEKINLTKEKTTETPTPKKVAKKQPKEKVVEATPVEDDLSFLDKVDEVLDVSFLDDLDNII